MNDTPRTDAFFYESAREPSLAAWLKFARCLERDLTAERDQYVRLSEKLKMALRMPGTGSYVEWAAECRAAVDERDRLEKQLLTVRGLCEKADAENGRLAAELAEARGLLQETLEWPIPISFAEDARAFLARTEGAQSNGSPARPLDEFHQIDQDIAESECAAVECPHGVEIFRYTSCRQCETSSSMPTDRIRRSRRKTRIP